VFNYTKSHRFASFILLYKSLDNYLYRKKMFKLAIIIRRRGVYRKVYLRGFTTGGQNNNQDQEVSLVDANNGRNIDRTQDIANEFRGDRAGLETYFRDKESSIERDFLQDSESGVADGVSENELQGWKDNRDDMLEQLQDQKDDVFDLASISDDGQNSANGASDGNSVASNTNGSSYHAQDSSDVVQTDFPSFDPFEE